MRHVKHMCKIALSNYLTLLEFPVKFSSKPLFFQSQNSAPKFRLRP